MIKPTIDKKPRQRWIELHPECNPKRADADPRVCSRCRRILKAEIAYIVLGLDGFLCRNCCLALKTGSAGRSKKQKK